MLRSNRTTTTNLCACVPSRISLRSSLSAIRQSTANVESHTHSRRLGVCMLCVRMRVARQSTVRQKIMEDGRLWIRENKMEIFALRDLAHTHTGVSKMPYT